MAAPANLKRFEVNENGQGYTLHIEDDSGNALELLATRDQLDVIADSLDDVLLQDDSGDEVGD